MTSESQAIITAIAIGALLTGAGFYVFHRVDPPKPVRVLLGVALLFVCIALAYPLMSSGDLVLHPVRMGLAIALFGVGINQVMALQPVAMSKDP